MTDKKITTQTSNPLHGITLKQILEALVGEYGWDGLTEELKMNCFNSEPSINSSLKFLRQTPWARKKVERLYLQTMDKNSYLTDRGLKRGE